MDCTVHGVTKSRLYIYRKRVWVCMGIHLKMKSLSQSTSSSLMFTTALFTVTKTQGLQSVRPQMNGSRRCDVYTVEYYTFCLL